MLTVSRRFRFEAAHRLPHYEGKCKNLHGHGYVLEVEVAGEVLHPPTPISDTGMIVDFGKLKALVQELVLDRLDHQDLNEVLGLNYRTQPTAEETVRWIVERLQEPLFDQNLSLEMVRLYETPDNWATWRCDADQ